MKTSQKKTKAVKRPARSRTSHERRAKVDRPPRLPWDAMTTYTIMASRSADRKRLGLFITGNPADGYVAGALAVANAETMEDVLEHHAHHVIGEYKSLHVAMSAAEEYGGKWQRRELPEAQECACEDIEAPQAHGSIGVPLPPPPLMVVIDDGTLPKDLHARAAFVIAPEGKVLKNRYGATTPEALGPSVILAAQVVYQNHIHASEPS